MMGGRGGAINGSEGGRINKGRTRARGRGRGGKKNNFSQLQKYAPLERLGRRSAHASLAPALIRGAAWRLESLGKYSLGKTLSQTNDGQNNEAANNEPTAAMPSSHEA